MFFVIFAADVYGVTDESVFMIIWCFGVPSGGLVASEMPVSNVMKIEDQKKPAKTMLIKAFLCCQVKNKQKKY